MINCLFIDNDSAALKTFEDFLKKTFYLKLLGKYDELAQALPDIESGKLISFLLILKRQKFQELISSIHFQETGNDFHSFPANML